MPLPKTINGFVSDFHVDEVEHLGNNRKAEFDFEQRSIRVLRELAPSWQATSFMHELTHLAFALTRGGLGSGDEQEEPTCEVIGRLLPKVLMDNPGILSPETVVDTVDIIGESWLVRCVHEPYPEDDGSVGWLDFRNQTMRLRHDNDLHVQRLRLFQLVGKAVLSAGYIEDFGDTYYLAMLAMLYALLRSNPQAHPRAVIADAE